jgi:hypothetical protein
MAPTKKLVYSCPSRTGQAEAFSFPTSLLDTFGFLISFCSFFSSPFLLVYPAHEFGSIPPVFVVSDFQGVIGLKFYERA